MTAEQRAAYDYFADIAEDLGLRVRADTEGWPIVPGRLGRLEYHDRVRAAIFTNRPRIHARIQNLPGIIRHQTGDRELRALIPMQNLSDAAAAIKAYRKPRLSPQSLQNLSAGSATRFGTRPT